MARLLVEYGANVDALDSELWTPLHAASTCAHVHLCRFLVEQSVVFVHRSLAAACRLVGVNHAGGGGRDESPQNLEWDANKNCPPDFQKNNA